MISIADHLRQEGRLEGRQEGEKRGEKRGAEKNSKEIAMRMLAEDLPLETIARLTDLTVDQIKVLADRGENLGYI